jgi:hypothetical protein
MIYVLVFLIGMLVERRTEASVRLEMTVQRLLKEKLNDRK